MQTSPYAASGGQPGHDAGWVDGAVNEATADFYRNTRKTLESAWVRPRHDGYMAFQQQASDRINTALKRKEESSRLIADLNRLFQKSFS